ncbi:T9SS type A sorting domain-containing protein [candidate division WOR-3 bacterium]|nr:T9SS type A sorting domain-containing protein [candidate division WOR-3 bacterium]
MGWAEASDIYTQPDNNILVVGTNGYSGCPIKLIKYDPNGNLIDADSVGMDWYGLDVAMVEDSNVVVTGGIGGQPNYTSIPLLVKFNGQGDTLWTTTYELPPGYISGKGYAIAVDSEDHVIIAGDVEDPDRIGDILVIKYGLIPGGAQILWSRIYDSGALQPPTIQSVTDIPDDQGKWVRVTWSASPNDSSNSPNPITLYGIWRRIDTLSTRAGSGLTLPDSKEVIRFEGWDGVGTVAAVQESIYNFVSPTLVDSNATGINYSVFMITAHAQNPFDWIASEPDSGYSVDNIPPEPPYDLVAEVINNDVLLTWQVLLGYPDFSHFAVYRDTLAGFTPGDVNRIGTSEVAAYTDSSLAVGIYYYVVSALDVNGNESGYSNEVEAVITGIEEAGFDIPVSHALSQNHPNPFRVQTAISYELPRPGLVTIAIYNVAGQRIKTLVEEKKDAGYHTVPWDGRSNDGKPVSNGVYFCRMEVDEYTSVKKILLTR